MDILKSLLLYHNLILAVKIRRSEYRAGASHEVWPDGHPLWKSWGMLEFRFQKTKQLACFLGLHFQPTFQRISKQSCVPVPPSSFEQLRFPRSPSHPLTCLLQLMCCSPLAYMPGKPSALENTQSLLSACLCGCKGLGKALHQWWAVPLPTNTRPWSCPCFPLPSPFFHFPVS